MKVAVGLSGGVDSTVAALLLKEQGHEVVGVTMTLGRPDDDQMLLEANVVAERLGIQLKVFDLAKLWQREVVSFVRDTYLAGKTPNPCIRCNERVKFSALPSVAFELGCDLFATGHYARLEGGHLLRGVDRSKDQSYFLYRVSKKILSRTLLPLGAIAKSEVRMRAREFGLDVAEKNDSQDFCSGNPVELLGITPRAGNIVDESGRILGRHQGYWNYTVGKRKGLGIGGGTPYYVIGINAERNEVQVGFKASTIVSQFRISDVVEYSPDLGEGVMVKVRSAGEPRGPVKVAMEHDGKSAVVSCPDGISGVAAGQSAVFYSEDVVVGGGIIV